VLAGLTRQEAGTALAIATELVALAGFTYLVSRASRVLAPAQPWLLATTLLTTAASQLLVPRLLDFQRVSVVSFALLGCLPTACQVVGTGWFLWRLGQRRPLQ